MKENKLCVCVCVCVCVYERVKVGECVGKWLGDELCLFSLVMFLTCLNPLTTLLLFHLPVDESVQLNLLI